MTGFDPVHIVLRMTLRAKTLLVEEYPMASRCTRADGEEWMLETDIYALEGAGRFILGLLDEVRIESGDALQAYIDNYAEKYFKKCGKY